MEAQASSMTNFAFGITRERSERNSVAFGESRTERSLSTFWQLGEGDLTLTLGRSPDIL